MSGEPSIEAVVDAVGDLGHVPDDRVDAFELHDFFELVDGADPAQIDERLDDMLHPLGVPAVRRVPDLDETGPRDLRLQVDEVPGDAVGELSIGGRVEPLGPIRRAKRHGRVDGQEGPASERDL